MVVRISFRSLLGILIFPFRQYTFLPSTLPGLIFLSPVSPPPSGWPDCPAPASFIPSILSMTVPSYPVVVPPSAIHPAPRLWFSFCHFFAPHPVRCALCCCE